MSGKPHRTKAAYMRGVYAATDGGKAAAELWAEVAQEIHGGEWLVTLRGDHWLTLGGLEAAYARRYPEALLEEIVEGAQRHEDGHTRVSVGVGVGIVPLLILGLLALPVLLVVVGIVVLYTVVVGIARLIDRPKGKKRWTT